RVAATGPAAPGRHRHHAQRRPDHLLLARERSRAQHRRAAVRAVLRPHGSAGAESAHRRSQAMNIDRAVFAFAGFVVLASLGLGLFVHPYWFGLTAFVGANMFQAAW